MRLTISKLYCWLFGHKDEFVRSVETTEPGELFRLYKCTRCGQTSWLQAWYGTLGAIAVWDRALTSEEMQSLFEMGDALKEGG